MCLSTMICVFVEKSPENIRSYIYYILPLAPIPPPLPPFLMPYYFIYTPIPCPHMPCAIRSSIYVYNVIMNIYGAYNGLERVIAILVYYTINLYILLDI